MREMTQFNPASFVKKILELISRFGLHLLKIKVVNM